MAKRKVKISLTEQEYMLLDWILSEIPKIKTKTAQKQFSMNEEKQKMYVKIQDMISNVLWDDFPPTAQELYQITGGYLSEGVHISPDGDIYSN
jgi:predicted transcriptional regulator